MTSLISVPDRISVAALLVAAGRGLRAGLDIPKQYLDLAGETMLTRSIRALAADKRVKQSSASSIPMIARATTMRSSRFPPTLKHAL